MIWIYLGIAHFFFGFGVGIGYFSCENDLHDLRSPIAGFSSRKKGLVEIIVFGIILGLFWSIGAFLYYVFTYSNKYEEWAKNRKISSAFKQESQ